MLMRESLLSLKSDILSGVGNNPIHGQICLYRKFLESPNQQSGDKKSRHADHDG